MHTHQVQLDDQPWRLPPLGRHSVDNNKGSAHLLCPAAQGNGEADRADRKLLECALPEVS